VHQRRSPSEKINCEAKTLRKAVAIADGLATEYRKPARRPF
jgi:hypothetical protein